MAPAAVCDTDWNTPSVRVKTFFFIFPPSLCSACGRFRCGVDFHSGQSGEKKKKSFDVTSSLHCCTAQPPTAVNQVCLLAAALTRHPFFFEGPLLSWTVGLSASTTRRHVSRTRRSGNWLLEAHAGAARLNAARFPQDKVQAKWPLRQL